MEKVRTKVLEKKRLYHLFIDHKRENDWMIYREAKRCVKKAVAAARTRFASDGSRDGDATIEGCFEKVSTGEFAHSPVPGVPPTFAPVQPITIEKTMFALKRVKAKRAVQMISRRCGSHSAGAPLTG
ncbi:hypothetical protein Y032_0037g3406 [Ancylostoma ceylanicum]|uniref:Uncharacterized protein n=1 Tax=Ancylostoma ceylanicum TaxID=53326 RepID=A0A016UL33_9BILA|nr:hypothetical protein Y032_0037g3406 [Ancylostoma ceylanicum]